MARLFLARLNCTETEGPATALACRDARSTNDSFQTLRRIRARVRLRASGVLRSLWVSNACLK